MLPERFDESVAKAVERDCGHCPEYVRYDGCLVDRHWDKKSLLLLISRLTWDAETSRLAKSLEGESAMDGSRELSGR